MESDATRATLLHVDAFAETSFKGNPAGVCLLQSAAPEEWMQNVANEMNLAEVSKHSINQSVYVNLCSLLIHLFHNIDSFPLS